MRQSAALSGRAGMAIKRPDFDGGDAGAGAAPLTAFLLGNRSNALGQSEGVLLRAGACLSDL
jgi:hypothetical protein